MAILTLIERAVLRNLYYQEGGLVTFHRDQLSTLAQAVEDWFETNRASLSSALDTAAAPLILTPAQKRTLVKAWLIHKFQRGG